ncbi:PREDICTED: uncharacterized protein LOC104597115 [Nelumbo nucifera]|uniref:Uncharacterized protein LOC104597115 n=2 Tax=Nelumbo nucifera TaxID=4432 RepID=A0A1U7ZRG0_NELNU|nr:PREDICTED: uncharacterized protein LOC104597115 [Nelumbo nucifera]DAD26513.1 TPA_asm: hypothetical protein HUJ06_027981 [Nelumbo nucifera]
MLQTRETSQEFFKSWNFFASPAEKNGGIFSLTMKVTFVVFLLASTSLVFYSAFSSQSRWLRFSRCEGGVNNPGDQSETVRRISAGGDYGRTNVSHILFGIGGSAKTWKDRRHYSELWWKPNITRGFVWLDEKPDEKEPWPENSPPYRVSEDSSRFKYTSRYGSRSAVRIARIVLESFRLGLENVRWFVMGDDDTVLFVETLVSVLSKYDHNQMYYIGGNSESVEQDVIHSYGMAFGGGGFAISYPLAAELVKVLDECIDRYASLYGSDQKIQACLSEIGVPVTKELGFHQVDIRGDPYGLLASHPVAPLVSLHHLGYVKPLFPNQTQLESLRSLFGAYKADPGRTLQQSFCYDLDRNWSVSVSWGYTAQIYPYLLTAKELETALQTFRTWRSWSNEPFTFNTRPLSARPCERPLIYFLDRVNDQVGPGQTLTSYKRFVEDPGKVCNQSYYDAALTVRSVNVSASIFETDEWKKAPRRQCCEITHAHGVDSVVQIRIRSCKPRESVTPP